MNAFPSLAPEIRRRLAGFIRILAEGKVELPCWNPRKHSDSFFNPIIMAQSRSLGNLLCLVLPSVSPPYHDRLHRNAHSVLAPLRSPPHKCLCMPPVVVGS